MRKEIKKEVEEIEIYCDVCQKHTEEIEFCRICQKDICYKCRIFKRIPSDSQPYTASIICSNCQKDFSPWIMELDNNLSEYQAKDRQTRIEYAKAIMTKYPDKQFFC